MISIVLADDHTMVRMGFKMILEQQPDFKVIGEASDPDSAFDLVISAKPDVLVTDVSMGTEKSGLVLAERVAESQCGTHTVVLTMHDDQVYLRQAFTNGALGYVLKSSDDSALVDAVRAASVGEVSICPEMLSGFVRDSINGYPVEKAELTPRESEIVSLAVKGYSNADIATRLCISAKTVEGQKSRIMTKLGLSSKPELFDYAMAHGIISD